MNRDTEKNVAAAGFKINKIELHYLDIVKSIYASKSSLWFYDSDASKINKN